MGKNKVYVKHALFMFNANDQQVNGTAVYGDHDKARRLAQSTLKLMPDITYIHIHVYNNVGIMEEQPLERVDGGQEQ